jgi:hypothetical protein
MNSVFKAYLITGMIACALFGTAALSGWHLPSSDWGGTSSTGSSSRSVFFGGGSSSGRSSGGSWGGGK